MTVAACMPESKWITLKCANKYTKARALNQIVGAQAGNFEKWH